MPERFADPELDLNRARVFSALVEAGSFVRAAKILRQPKSRVSRNLAALEEQLGVQLIYRTTRRFQLTEAGRLFYEGIHDHLIALDSAAREVGRFSTEISGRIRIGAPEDFGTLVVTELVDEFADQHRNVKFDLHFSNRMVNLVEEGIDLTIRIGRMPDESVKARRVGTMRFWLVASPKFLHRCPNMEDPGQIEKVPFIKFTGSGGTQPIALFSSNGRIELNPDPAIQGNNFFAIRHLTLHGHGLAIMPEFLCREPIQRGELVHVLKEWGPQPEPIHVVVPAQREPTLAVRTLSQFVARRLSEQFA
ncbi:MAG: LysR family transcriptional regulator [Acidobacteria bacterium]|nr:LysR family transcriptional regulator [Acidobacteriota bacterium]MCB9396344.1 LysR family transcriptional regulator [Acidobacteriota bacterium]